jgi:hypothetical protein
VKDLGGLLPSLTSSQINVGVRYVERSRTIVIDNDGSVIWVRNDGKEQLTLRETAQISDELADYIVDEGVQV